MCLDTAYFAENWKQLKNKKKVIVHFAVTVHMPWCNVHVPWTVHQALVKKKKKTQNVDVREAIQMVPKIEISNEVHDI